MNNLSKLNALCDASHNLWRKHHIYSRGNIPRNKCICGYEFDINNHWEDLNPLWRMKSRGEHTDYVKIKNISSMDIEQLSRCIHDIWMDNNRIHANEEWCKYKFCEYQKLPENEKEFDRDIAKMLKSL